MLITNLHRQLTFKDKTSSTLINFHIYHHFDTKGTDRVYSNKGSCFVDRGHDCMKSTLELAQYYL